MTKMAIPVAMKNVITKIYALNGLSRVIPRYRVSTAVNAAVNRKMQNMNDSAKSYY